MEKFLQPRELNKDERAMLDFLLSADFQGRTELRKQAESVQAVAVCECGCGTIDLKVSGMAARAFSKEPIPVEAHGAGVEVLLFVRDGFLRLLEVVDYGDSRPFPYPRVQSLKLWIPPFSKPDSPKIS